MNPALCIGCGLVFEFGSARETYEAMATNKECAADCPKCGKRIKYSEARALLLAESDDTELATFATEIHGVKERDQFETAGLVEMYKELGRRYAGILTRERAQTQS